MVRFKLRDDIRKVSIMMDVPKDETINELSEVVNEYWGEDDVLFIKGYMVLDRDMTFGDAVSDGDIIDVMPDLGRLREVS